MTLPQSMHGFVECGLCSCNICVSQNRCSLLQSSLDVLIWWFETSPPIQSFLFPAAQWIPPFFNFSFWGGEGVRFLQTPPTPQQKLEVSLRVFFFSGMDKSTGHLFVADGQTEPTISTRPARIRRPRRTGSRRPARRSGPTSRGSEPQTRNGPLGPGTACHE